MSFDLAVFRATKAIDDAGALAIYRALCDGKKPALETSKRPRAFYAALTKQFPELDDDADAKDGVLQQIGLNLDREKLSGPAGRFWRSDRGLLLVTATVALATPTKKLLQ